MKNAEETIIILLKYVQPQKILNREITYDQWREEEFVKFGTAYMKHYTEGENRLLYRYLDRETNQQDAFPGRNGRGKGLNPFNLVLLLVRNLLVIADNKLAVHYEKFLEWRKLTVQLSEDIFTCAYLADQGVAQGRDWENLCWDTVIGHNNLYLSRLVEQGISENHFHLWASAPYFQLSWVAMMNQSTGVGDYQELFREMDRRKQYVGYYLDELYGNVPYRIQCLQAMLIRAYLYAWLTGGWLELGEYRISRRELETYLSSGESDRLCETAGGSQQISIRLVRGLVPEKWYRQQCRKEAFQMVKTLMDSPWSIEAYQPEILSAISSLRQFETVDDYVGLHLAGTENLSKAERIYCGERWFLYQMFYRIFRDKAGYREEYNWFYAYLVIKEGIRSELVQVNDKIGFLNFQRYSKRKNKGLPGGKEAYVSQMALENTLRSPWLQSLEVRIAPRKTALENKAYIQMLDKRLRCRDRERCFYVFHFAKGEDRVRGIADDFVCRHYEKRGQIRKQAEEMVRFRERYPITAKRVKGIDACSYEIGCRPEVFAQAFRYLKNHVLRIEGWDGVETVPQLRITYHVGEDYLDLADGLRAIDEAIRFLELDCGDRLGHAIALGYDPERWYREKNYKIFLPEQDYIDNLAWMYGRIVEFKVAGQDSLLHFLEKEFEYSFRRVYGHSIPGGNRDFSILTYYYAQRLRGDRPEYYQNCRCQETADYLDSYNNYALGRQGTEKENYREIAETVILYYLYHYDGRVKEAGRNPREINIDRQWIRGVAALQKKMQSYVAMRGIAIETNPSSNVMISGLQKYDEHPIIRFYNKHLVNDRDKLDACAQLSVSINTDDKGIFSTSLENEYALIACALEQCKDEEDNYLYDKTSVYEWVEQIRKFGNMQSFGDSPKRKSISHVKIFRKP